MSEQKRPAAAALLAQGTGLLNRSHLRELGLERRGIDAAFRALPTVHLPGYARPLLRVEDYLAFVSASTYRDDRVRPVGVDPRATGR